MKIMKNYSIFCPMEKKKKKRLIDAQLFYLRWWCWRWGEERMQIIVDRVTRKKTIISYFIINFSGQRFNT